MTLDKKLRVQQNFRKLHVGRRLHTESHTSDAFVEIADVEDRSHPSLGCGNQEILGVESLSLMLQWDHLYSPMASLRRSSVSCLTKRDKVMGCGRERNCMAEYPQIPLRSTRAEGTVYL